MSLIVSPARLERLHDGKRARIIYSDGTKSMPFATQAMAKEIIEAALFRAKMNTHEAALVAKHIEKSIKILFSSEMDRWCNAVSDAEEEELQLVTTTLQDFGSREPSMTS